MNDLKRANDIDSLRLFNIFVKKFALFNNAKKREISNSIASISKNLDNIVKENNNNKETRHKTKDNVNK